MQDPCYSYNTIRSALVGPLRITQSEVEHLGAFIRHARSYWSLSEKERGRRRGNCHDYPEPSWIYDAMCQGWPMILEEGLGWREQRQRLLGWHMAICEHVAIGEQGHWVELLLTIDRLLWLGMLLEGRVK